jgi:hypothetical protein
VALYNAAILSPGVGGSVCHFPECGNSTRNGEWARFDHRVVFELGLPITITFEISTQDRKMHVFYAEGVGVT